MQNNVLSALRTIAALCAWNALLLPAVAQQRTLSVRIDNPCADARHNKVVELDAARVLKKLQPAAGQVPVVRDDSGRRLTSQLTYDGKLLFTVSVEGKSARTYTLEAGAPTQADTLACGRCYPERQDDLAWENDCVAFRAYGPALRRSGEKAYGYDLFAKRVTYPMLVKMYDGELHRGISYHRDHGEGMDCYNVGPTLGCGTTALLTDGDSIVYPWVYERCEILDNGPLRFTARLVFPPLSLNGGDNVTETRIISLDRGNRLNKTVITYEGLSRKTRLLTGLVIHQNKPEAFRHESKARFIACEDPTNAPKAGNGLLFTGAVFDKQPERTEVRLFTDRERSRVRGAFGHVAAQSAYRPGKPFTYYWGYGWTKAGIADMNAWEAYLKTFADRLRHPLRIRY